MSHCNQRLENTQPNKREAISSPHIIKRNNHIKKATL